MTEDEMVGWHHRLSGHEFAQTPGDGEGRGSLVCYSPWGPKEQDMTEQRNIIIITTLKLQVETKIQTEITNYVLNRNQEY